MLASCTVALSVHCGPTGTPQEPVLPHVDDQHAKETPHGSPNNSPPVALLAEPESRSAAALKAPESAPSKQPSPNALRIGPQLSNEARAAGIYRLRHVPYKWPTRQNGPRTSGEPLVMPLGRPSPLPQPGQPRADGFVDFGYMMQTTITKTGALAMEHGVVDLDKWTTKDTQGTVVLTPPREWEGIVQQQWVWDKGNPAGLSLIAYGTQGLYNYREYVRRYLPWRVKRRDVPTRSGATAYSEIKTSLATLMTGLDGRGAHLDERSSPQQTKSESPRYRGAAFEI